MAKVEKFIIEGSSGKFMSIDVTIPEGLKEKAPVVIFSHGFKGFKDWGHFNLVAQKFGEQGFVFIKFNYSHNGVSNEHPTDFVNLEAFGENTYSKEVVDLKLMIDFVCESKSVKDIADIDKIYQIGHSKGGGNSILVASKDKRVKKICTWASVSRFGRMFNNKHFMEKWKEDGVVFIMNARTKQPMPMYYNFYEDYALNKENLDIKKAAADIQIPWLIIHGTKDFVVTIKEAKLLHSLNPNSKMIVNDGDHTFGGAHPWLLEELPILAEEVVQQTIEFFRGKE